MLINFIVAVVSIFVGMELRRWIDFYKKENEELND